LAIPSLYLPVIIMVTFIKLYSQSPAMIDTIIFDMDGVLVDSEKHWSISEAEFLATRIAAPHNEYHKDIVGMSISEIYDHLSSRYGIHMQKEEFLKSYDEMAVDIYKKSSNVMPGLMDFLILLRNNGYTMALASSSPRLWVSMTIERYELESFFKVTVSASEIACKSKPAPDIYLYTAKQLGKKPEVCLTIEDSRNGILSAKRAGMRCVGFRNGFNEEQDLSKADLVISNFEELTLDIINKF
jgi:HAD superfamily hydrolase (TIGR01509 family)